MRKVADVFTYLGAVIDVVYLWIALGVLQATTGISPLIFLIPFFYMVLVIVILVWRHKALEDGSKVGCGVCTLIFISPVGGILTLCIPQTTYYHYHSTPSYSNHQISNSSPSFSQKVTPLERALKVKQYDEQLQKGQITKSEYDRRIAILDGKPYTPPQPKPKVEEPKTEDEIIELIYKYKKLLDEGAITQEEYDAKKKQLLK